MRKRFTLQSEWIVWSIISNLFATVVRNRQTKKNKRNNLKKNNKRKKTKQKIERNEIKITKQKPSKI